jgi:hypothetical protein
MNIRETKHQKFLWTALLAILVLVPGIVRPQISDKPVRTVDAARRAAVIEKVIEQLNKYYIDPAVALRMEERLNKNLREGVYDEMSDQRAFLSRLTGDLRAVSHDLHLGVWPIELALYAPEDAPAEEKARLKALSRYNNNGMPRMTRLHGNIGYLEISYFEELDPGAETAVAAMNWLANSDALIIDLRRNGGGSDVAALVISYLFRQPVHTIDIYSKVDRTTRQQWTMPYVPGPRLADIPVYVLVSRRSASAAEGLSYALKNLGRGMVVGEITRGAANPIEEFSFPELDICLAVSAYRVSSPLTGTCWEGVGVTPDIAVPAEKALETACVEALKTLLKSGADDEIKEWRTWALDMYRALLDPVTIDETALAEYAGSYGPTYSVSASGATLSLNNKNAMSLTLIPLGQDRFAFSEEEGIGRFIRDEAGKVVALDVAWTEGFRRSLKKDAISGLPSTGRS